MNRRADVAVIGGGIVGLAFAWTAARAGLSVVLFERDRKVQGASVRNFGMVWPIGQPAGALHQRAMRSRELWVELAAKAGIAHDPIGSLHLAYRGDELAILEEFEDRSGTLGYDARLLTPAETIQRSPAVQPDGLLGRSGARPRSALTLGSRSPGYRAGSTKPTGSSFASTRS